MKGSMIFFIGNDKVTKWMKSCPSHNVRTKSVDMIIHLPGVKAIAKSVKTAVDCFSIFINYIIIRTITSCTNVNIQHIASNFTIYCDAKPTKEEEIKCLLGKLLKWRELKTATMHHLLNKEYLCPGTAQFVLGVKM